MSLMIVMRRVKQSLNSLHWRPALVGGGSAILVGGLARSYYADDALGGLDLTWGGGVLGTRIRSAAPLLSGDVRTCARSE
ncbi:hypothetical protein EJ06DRAFT_72285 [Trichodelitschia bisporula]|uniref:Uncharacterized protein n=1 Tax=Trichodelitschia bisporula TaxID=703511 RepID=A0A6G1HTA5_9PEZI|nr:hypothetical protein EJ06DRAFT_72285 [Trichodelitschia bisporula]